MTSEMSIFAVKDAIRAVVTAIAVKRRYGIVCSAYITQSSQTSIVLAIMSAQPNPAVGSVIGSKGGEVSSSGGGDSSSTKKKKKKAACPRCEKVMGLLKKYKDNLDPLTVRAKEAHAFEVLAVLCTVSVLFRIG